MPPKKMFFKSKNTAMDPERETKVETAAAANEVRLQQLVDEQLKFFDDIDKDPEGFKAAMHQLHGESGATLAQFIVEALAEFPDVVRFNPLTNKPKTEEERSQFIKRKAAFDDKFKARLSQMFSEHSPEERERALAFWKETIGISYDNDTVEYALQDLRLVDPETSSDTNKGKEKV